MGSIAPTTPQAYRSDDPLISVRQSFESELWDDTANVVFDTRLADQDIATATTFNTITIQIPSPVTCRLHVSVHAILTYPGVARQTAQIFARLDGTNGNDFYLGDVPTQSVDFNIKDTVHFSTIFDLSTGIHNLGLQLITGAGVDTVSYTNLAVYARRGRKPSSV